MLIYMPMIPEAIIAMLASARLGAIHSLVFGGFASRELSTRIEHAKVCSPEVHCKIIFIKYMSLVMRKPTFLICENKDADQLRGNREADRRLCFRCIDSTIPLLSKSEISSL